MALASPTCLRMGAPTCVGTGSAYAASANVVCIAPCMPYMTADLQICRSTQQHIARKHGPARFQGRLQSILQYVAHKCVALLNKLMYISHASCSMLLTCAESPLQYMRIAPEMCTGCLPLRPPKPWIRLSQSLTKPYTMSH